MTAPANVPLPAEGATYWWPHYEWMDASVRYVRAVAEGATTPAQLAASVAPKMDASRFLFCRGRVNNIVVVPNVARAIHVSFPVGKFTRAPFVSVNIQSTTVAVNFARAVSITAEGFDLVTQRTNTTAYTVDWEAWDDPDFDRVDFDAPPP